MFGRVLGVLLALALSACVEAQSPLVPAMNAPAVLGGVDLTAPNGYGRLFITKPMVPLASLNVRLKGVDAGSVSYGDYLVLTLPAGVHPITVWWGPTLLEEQRYQQFIRIVEGRDEFLTVGNVAEAPHRMTPRFIYVNYSHFEGKSRVVLPPEIDTQLRRMVPAP